MSSSDLFNSILAGHSAAAVATSHAIVSAQQAELDAYSAALTKHDWWHEWSDDGTVYERGHKQQKLLEQTADRLDRDYAIWNTIAPADCRKRRDADHPVIAQRISECF